MRLREYCESSHVARLLLHVISLVRRGIDFRLNTCRRAVLAKWTSPCLRGESFRGSFDRKSRKSCRARRCRRREELFDAIIGTKSREGSAATSQFLNQRGRPVKHLCIGIFFGQYAQHSGQSLIPKGKCRYLERILSSKQWCPQGAGQ